MADKKSFVIYDNWSRLFCGLPDETAGKLIKAVCGYKLGEGADVNDPIISAIYNMICEQLDADADKYADICEKRSLARKSKTKQMITNDNKCEQMLSNATDNENDNENDNDIKKNKRFVAPSVEDVAAYCKERNNGIDAKAFVDFYESKGWMIGKNKMKDWRSAVRTWERRQDKPKPKQNSFNNFTQRQYDFAELEKYM